MAEPLCEYFGKCGGCSFQHLDYSIQLDNKKKAVMSAVGYEDVKVFSGKEYGYRNRMDLIFHPKGIGFRERGKWYNIIDIEQCLISNERLNQLIKEVRDFFRNADYFDIRKHSGTFRYAVIRTPKEDSSVSFVLNSESSRLNDAVERIKEFAEKTTAKNVIITYVPSQTEESVSGDFFAVKGNDMLKESLMGKQFIYSVQGFFQNNSEMAEKMQEHCSNLLKKYDTKNAYLLDLYGGVGTFGIINSGLFKGVTIVESVKECIDAADRNIESNEVKNAKAILLDAAKLKNLPLQKPLFAITDPPRSGMHPKTIEELKRLKPNIIVYVSCNVQQLGKDLIKFSDYEIKSTAMFDLFPQTPHAEAVVELALKQ